MTKVMFKAKKNDNDEWVESGSIVQFKDNGVLSVFMPISSEICICEHDGLTSDILSISNCRFYKVDPETVCMYTGMKDSCGTKIFEHDICVLDGDYAEIIYDEEDGMFYLLDENDILENFSNIDSKWLLITGNACDRVQNSTYEKDQGEK